MKRAATAAAFAAMLFAASAAQADSMPQLDFANPLLKTQVIWGAVIFAAFYYLSANWGLPKVGAILQMRADTIAADLNAARAARDRADAAVAELTAARKKAFSESQAAIAAAVTKAKAEAAARAADQEAKLAAQLAGAEAEIARARTTAMGALRAVASDTAIAVVTRLTGGAADEEKVQLAVGNALTARGLA